jgi:hypothetical protein
MLASGVRSGGHNGQPTGEDKSVVIQPTVNGHERLVSWIHDGLVLGGGSKELAWLSKVWLQDALHASMASGSIGAGEASLKRKAPSQARNRMSCSVSASVPRGARGTGDQVGRGGSWLPLVGNDKKGGATACGREVSGIRRNRPVRGCPRPLRARSCPTEEVGQRSRRNLGADISSPTRSTAGCCWDWRGRERSKLAENTLEGGRMQHALERRSPSTAGSGPQTES